MIFFLILYRIEIFFSGFKNIDIHNFFGGLPLFNQFDLAETLLRLPAILFALSIHEFSHAYAATRFGDETPGKQGRLTLNPLAHIDPMGFLFLVLLRFGWAKPVLINPAAFKNPKRDEIVVSLAGPFSNIIAAVFFGGIFKLLAVYGSHWFALENLGEALFMMLLNFIIINIGLAVFNMLPIPPLDGSHLISALIPNKYFHFKVMLFKYGSVALIAVIFAEMILNINILPIGRIILLLSNIIFRLFDLGIRF